MEHVCTELHFLVVGWMNRLIPQRELFACLFKPVKVRLKNYILGEITLKAREKSCEKTVI